MPGSASEFLINCIHVHEPARVQAKPSFRVKNTPHRCIETLFRNASRLRCRPQRFERRIRYRWHQQTIRSRRDCAHRRFSWRVAHSDSAHVHRIGNNKALIAELIAQQIGEYVVRKRRRRVGVGLESRNVQMPRHDAVDLHGDGNSEGNKFKLIKASAIGANHRKIDVRVCSRVAVARKMFSRRQTSIFLHAANELAHKLRDALRIFAKGPRVDDRISGIIVYIRVWRIDPVNSDGACLECRDLAHRVGVFWIATGGNCHCRWKRGALIQPHCRAALEIRADQKRQF